MTILSLNENTFAFNLVTTAGLAGSGLWLGGFQPPGTGEPSAGFQWVTGEPFSFTRFGGGEPNDLGGEDFIQYQSDGFWNDIADGARGYVLEIERQVPPSGVPEGGSALCLLGIALLGLEGLRRKFASS